MQKDIWLSFCILDWSLCGNPVERAACKDHLGLASSNALGTEGKQPVMTDWLNH